MPDLTTSPADRWDVPGSGPEVLVGTRPGSRSAGAVLAALDLLRGRGVVPLRTLAVVGTGPLGPGPVGCFLEVQDAAAPDHRGAAVRVVAGTWPRGRWRLEVTGTPAGAGTPVAERTDPLLTLAVTVLAAGKAARVGGHRATVGRVELADGADDAVAGRATGWLDARAASRQALEALVADVVRVAVARAERDGTTFAAHPEAVHGGVALHPPLVAALAARLGPAIASTPVVERADLLQAAGVPSALVLVDPTTCTGTGPVEALAGVLEDLLTQPLP